MTELKENNLDEVLRKYEVKYLYSQTGFMQEKLQNYIDILSNNADRNNI